MVCLMENTLLQDMHTLICKVDVLAAVLEGCFVLLFVLVVCLLSL